MKWILLLVALVLLIGCQPDNSELWDSGRTYNKGDLCQEEGGNTGSWGVTVSVLYDYPSLQDGNKGHDPGPDTAFTGEGVWWKCLGYH